MDVIMNMIPMKKRFTAVAGAITMLLIIPPSAWAQIADGGNYYSQLFSGADGNLYGATAE